MEQRQSTIKRWNLIVALVLSAAMLAIPFPLTSAKPIGLDQTLPVAVMAGPEPLPQPSVSEAVEPPPLMATGVTTPTGATAEIAALRTSHSRTFAGGNGQRIAQISAAALHYRAASGSWQPIDNRLVASRAPGFAFQNAANSFQAFLPNSLGSGAARVVADGDWIEFSLNGASGSATIDRSTATYAEALPSVAVRLTAESDALKEELVLASRAAANVFTYTLQASSGLTPRSTASGAIEFTRSNGEVRFGLGAPFMVDAGGALSGAVSQTIAASGAGWRLVVRADRAWLDAPERKWPVTIDPTITLSPGSLQCTIGFAFPIGCGYLAVGSGIEHRGLVRFNLASANLPTSTTVVDANLGLTVSSANNTFTATFKVNRLTEDWNSAVTWLSRDGASAWTNPGGTFDATSYDLTVSGLPNFLSMVALRDIVQSWVSGAAPNYGLIVRAPPFGSASPDVLFSVFGPTAPFLNITYFGPDLVRNYNPIAPVRVLDTRGAFLTGFNADGTPITPGPITVGQTKRILLNGKTFSGFTVPTTTASVALNVITIAPALGGWVTVWPGSAATTPPNAPTTQVQTGLANNFWLTKLGDDGTLNISALTAAPVDVLIELVGIFTADAPAVDPGRFKLINPTRVVDTGASVGFDETGAGIGNADLPSGATRRYKIAGLTFGFGLTTFPSDTRAVYAHITIVQGAATAGYYVVYAGDAGAAPFVATVLPVTPISFNSWLTPLGLAGPNAGTIAVTNNAGLPGRVIVDVMGYYAPSNAVSLSEIVWITPTRILDTRGAPVGPIGYDGSTGNPISAGPLPANQTRYFRVAGKQFGSQAIPSTARGIVANITTVGGPAGGYVALFPADAISSFGAASVNPSTFVAESVGLVSLPATPPGNIALRASLAIDVVIDVIGYYIQPP